MSTAPAPARPARNTPRLELAAIVRAHGAAYRHTHTLARAQCRALDAIAACRTATLGGHREVCERCGGVRISYNSCRNRHCPKCQTVAKERWLEARRAELLPVEYFHVVFTLPHALNALAQGNPRVIYTLVFRAARDTLLAFGRDPRHLGGEIGVTAILHTWGQTLGQHLHLHGLVTGGALAREGTRWIPARSARASREPGPGGTNGFRAPGAAAWAPSAPASPFPSSPAAPRIPIALAARGSVQPI